jgi:hypothetical protein
MHRNTTRPVPLIACVKRWIQSGKDRFRTAAVFAAGWEDRARDRFAMWLQDASEDDRENRGALDVPTEADIATYGSIPHFGNPASHR